jgi:hypothetical protein
VTILLSVSDNAVYFGIGRDPESTLKKSIDANSGPPVKSEIVGQYNVFLTPIMNLAAQVESENDMVQVLMEKIAEIGRDRIRITYDIVNGEMQLRGEVQDGVVHLMGAAGEQMQQQMMSPPGADF